MKIKFLNISILAALFLLIVCGSFTPLIKVSTNIPTEIILEGKTMGTFWRVNMICTTPERTEELRNKIQVQLDADEKLLSTYKNDSVLMRFNRSRSTKPWPISEAMADIITKSLRVGYKTNGAMDITIGPLVNLWGFWFK